MTQPKKSKPLRVLTAFLVGGITYGIGANSVYGQDAGSDRTFFGVLRGSIDDAPARTTNNLDLNSANGRRAQLLGQGVDTAVPSVAQRPVPRVPLPLSPRVQQRAQRATPQPIVFNPESVNEAPQQNIAVDPIQSGTAPVVDADPFAPTGFRIGTFEGNASLEQSFGYSSNLSQAPNGEGGVFSQTDVILGLTSNWSRHQWQTNLRGSYRLPFDGDQIARPQFNADTALRFDLRDGITLTAAAAYSAQTQDFTSTILAPGAVDNPLVETYGASIELDRSDRKLQFTLRGSIERDTYEDADLGAGITFSQADLNNTDYGLSLRLGYEVSPALTPFIEGQYIVRSFDQQIDRNGNRRDSNIFNLRGGVEIDLGEKVQGEIALGFVRESFDDAALEDLTGFTIDGQLIWSPEQDTQIGLTVGTSTNSSIVADESGSVIYNARLDAQRQINSRWSLNGFIDYQVETNDDRNTTLALGVGTEYWVNRFMALTGDLEYESFSSDAANSDFDEVSARLGILLQR